MGLQVRFFNGNRTDKQPGFTEALMIGFAPDHLGIGERQEVVRPAVKADETNFAVAYAAYAKELTEAQETAKRIQEEYDKAAATVGAEPAKLPADVKGQLHATDETPSEGPQQPSAAAAPEPAPQHPPEMTEATAAAAEPPPPAQSHQQASSHQQGRDRR